MFLRSQQTAKEFVFATTNNTFTSYDSQSKMHTITMLTPYTKQEICLVPE